MSPWSRVVLSILALHGLASAAAGDDCGAFEDDERTSYRQIRWGDFQAPRPDHLRPQLVAQISTSVRIHDLEVELTERTGEWLARPRSVCIRAYMRKDRSVQITKYREREVLDHEQGHFDIAQLCAYELRGSIDRLEAHSANPVAAESLLRSRLRDLYRSVVAGCVKMHARYERETCHGNLRSSQRRWRGDLAARLLRSATEGRGVGSVASVPVEGARGQPGNSTAFVTEHLPARSSEFELTARKGPLATSRRAGSRASSRTSLAHTNTPAGSKSRFSADQRCCRSLEKAPH